MLEASTVSKQFLAGREIFRAVDGVSMRVGEGEFVAIVGHSGSGKTTLLNLLGGLTHPDQGTIRIDDVDIGAIGDDRLAELRNRTIGFVYQFASLMPTLNVVENILLPTMFAPVKKSRADALRLLEDVGLTEKAEAMPAELSGGQQRRVAIARAFINEPRLILADEPTGDLDEDTEAEILGFFRHMNRERSVTFVIVTHNLALAATAQRTYHMTAGRLAVAGG